MSNFVFRPGAKLFNQIADLENLAGELKATSKVSLETGVDLIKKETCCFLMIDGGGGNLDPSQLKLFAKPVDSVPRETELFPVKARFSQFLAALESEPEKPADEIAQALALEFPRSSRASIQTPSESFIFQALEHFVVEARLKKQLIWVKEEGADLHPVIRAAILHLEFLQISPFNRLNHFVSLCQSRARLLNSGYPALREVSLGQELVTSQEKLFACLRQAERTCPGSCATLNIWLEFFTECLHQSLLQARSLAQKKLRLLPSSQLEIVRVIKSRGSASREQIVRDTGLKTATVKYNLSQLAEKGLLFRTGGGRSTSWSVSTEALSPEKPSK